MTDTAITAKEFLAYNALAERIRDKILRGRATKKECIEYERIKKRLNKFVDNQYEQ